MEIWEIDRVDKLTEEEQKRYYEKLIDSYKNKIQELKIAKKEGNMKAFKASSWRTVLIAAAIAIFACPLMMAIGEGALKTAGEYTSLGAVLGFTGSILASMNIDDNGPGDILYGIREANDAKKQIKELKGKIKEIKKKPVMGKR